MNRACIKNSSDVNLNNLSYMINLHLINMKFMGSINVPLRENCDVAAELRIALSPAVRPEASIKV